VVRKVFDDMLTFDPERAKRVIEKATWTALPIS
jgi:hypothetical protein